MKARFHVVARVTAGPGVATVAVAGVGRAMRGE